MKSFFSRIISLIFPETCVICGKENTSLCPACIQTFPLPPYLEESWMHALFSYQDKKVRDTIHALKFKHLKSIVNHLAPLIHETIQDTRTQNIELREKNSITLLPVPKMQSHINARGFDAILYLCTAVATQDKDRYIVESSSVIRTNTKAQVGLSRQERLRNMKDAFMVVRADRLRHKTICIIDDVLTTGSTLRELRHVCLKAGAKEVFAVTIAH